MKSWYKSSLYRLESAAEDKGALRRAVLMGTEEMPSLKDFLGTLYRLEAVPMEYLICDEKFLPAESLRFFYIDEKWVDFLIDGALSMGRNSTMDLYHDTFVHTDALRQLRARPYGKQEGLCGMRTGFLLRSDLVRGWPGLVVSCYAKNSGEKKSLECRNISRIGEDILFCIADGIISCLEFTEPKEGVSFGFTCDEQGELSLPLFPLPKPGVDETARMFRGRKNDSRVAPIPFRDQTTQGVVDIEKLCDLIGEKLGMSEAEREHLSALEFAAELLQTPVRYSVKGRLL